MPIGWCRSSDDHGEDPSIRAVVVRIQSPGGVVGPTQEIHDAIQRLRSRGKPVVASMGSVAASGGYYLAAAATRIVANPGTLTGSIGVILQLAEIEGLLRKVGVRYEIIKSGRYKDAGSFARPMTPDERAVLQAVLDDMHDQFVTAVAEGRRLPKERARALADGRVFSGRMAKDGRPGRRPRRDGRGDPARRRARRHFRQAARRSATAVVGVGRPGGLAGRGNDPRVAPRRRGAAPGLPALPLIGSPKLPLYLMD